jgi:hypothetical protein
MTNRQSELLSDFLAHEVTTTEELLHCLAGPATADAFRRMLLLFLRGHYASSVNYMDGFKHLQCYVWNPDEKLSKLAIEFTHNSDDRKPDDYPGIYVGFGEASYEKVALGNHAGNTQDLSGSHVTKEAVVNYEVFHVAKRASDAYDLAEMTARVLLAMGPVMAKNGGATGFEVTGMRKPVEKKPSPKDQYTVAIPVRIAYSLAVTRTLESHRIRIISQILTAEL